MKHILKMAIVALMFTAMSYAGNYSFVVTGGGDTNIIGNLSNEDGLTYNRSYYLPADVYDAKKITAIVVYSSASYSNVTFSTPSIAMGSANIAITAHGLTLGMQVKLEQTAGTVPGPLVAETTYYAIPISVNIVQLATTSAQAIAADPIIFVSSTTTGTQTYTLVPRGISGTPSFKWQASNNGSNVVDLDIQAVSITEYTAGGAKVGFDFDDFNYSTLILNVTAPTTGGLNIKTKANIKK